jgi:hypothetical protein
MERAGLRIAPNIKTIVQQPAKAGTSRNAVEAETQFISQCIMQYGVVELGERSAVNKLSS